MSGRIFTKLARSGHIGQVLTAGGLLAIAALLVFAVASTLEPVPAPPVTKTAPVSEPAETLPISQPVPAVSISQLPAAPLPPAAELPAAAAGQQDMAVGNENILELWR